MAIRGPLEPGQVAWSGEITVTQLSAQMALIEYGRSSVTIYGSDLPGEGYDFYVERQAAEAQRLVRISATPDV